jgi:hypothetical protein
MAYTSFLLMSRGHLVYTAVIWSHRSRIRGGSRHPLRMAAVLCLLASAVPVERPDDQGFPLLARIEDL